VPTGLSSGRSGGRVWAGHPVVELEVVHQGLSHVGQHVAGAGRVGLDAVRAPTGGHRLGRGRAERFLGPDGLVGSEVLRKRSYAAEAPAP